MVTFIADIKPELAGQAVVLRGWVSNLRFSGPIAFLNLRDGSGYMQVVAEKAKLSDKIWTDLESLNLESSLEIKAKVSIHPKKADECELQLVDLTVVHVNKEEYPISNKEHGVDFLLDNRHLWLRSKRQWAIQRVRNTIINATYEFFKQNRFIKIDAPILTPNSCEDTTELFELEYFDLGKAYLSQSGQLYIEAAIFAHNRVFDFGPVFRAEKSKTRRHLIEFWMMDAEMAFVEHDENMDWQEKLIKFIVKSVLETNASDLVVLERDVKPLENVVNKSFARIHYSDAVKQLQTLGSDIKDGEDFGADDETMLTNSYDVPIFVDRYPSAIKSFYMPEDPKMPGYALGNDLLAPEGYGEVIGGSQRIADYDLLKAKIESHNYNMKDWEWYLDLRKYGSVPHSGFGYGLERLVSWVCHLEHVRETIPFPRLLNRINP
jgi:asparaginyl-tRNA synthetase